MSTPVPASSVSEDASNLLADFVASLDNLPSEVAHLLAEIGGREDKVQDLRQRYVARTASIQKHHKAHGLLAENPKEPVQDDKAAADLKKALGIQKEKIKIATRGMHLAERHLHRLETELSKLCAAGGIVLPQIPNIVAPEITSLMDEEDALFQSPALLNRHDRKRKQPPTLANLSSNPPTPNFTLPSVPASGGPTMQQQQQQQQPTTPGGPVSVASTGPPMHRPARPKRARHSFVPDSSEEDDAEGEPDGDGDGEDQAIYCFCQRVSFGEMIGCDNPSCPYEWFHYSCVGLKQALPVNATWYCPACLPKMQNSNTRRRQK